MSFEKREVQEFNTRFLQSSKGAEGVLAGVEGMRALGDDVVVGEGLLFELMREGSEITLKVGSHFRYCPRMFFSLTGLITFRFSFHLHSQPSRPMISYANFNLQD